MQINNNISFKSNYRYYRDADGNPFGCYTTLFRSDLDWEKLAKFEVEHFKNKDKVNVVMFAASDGSEAYSKIISLFETAKKQVQKFFPIKAYDIDDEILKAAKGGYIKVSDGDIFEIQSRVENINDYFSETDKSIDIENDKLGTTFTTIKANKKLTTNVEFKKGDMFKEITKMKDNSNTILMCRNILGYFLNDKIEEFVKLASEFLKKGSLFVIGDYDRQYMNINELIKKYKFENVFRNVYKKI